MTKFFGSVNEVDSHKKSRQPDLTLDKYWVNQSGWLGLCTAVDMVISINNLLKIFCYGVKRYQYDKFMGIRKFSERLTIDWFNNNFTADTGTPEKKSLLDEVDFGDTVYNFCALIFPSSASSSTEDSTIYDLDLNNTSLSASTLADSTIGSQHNSEKEGDNKGKRYNMTARGYRDRRLHNWSICINTPLFLKWL